MLLRSASAKIRHPVRESLRQLNAHESTYIPGDDVERDVNMTRRAGSFAIEAREAAEQQQLESLHQASMELARLALPYVGTNRDVTALVEVISPLPQDRLYSEKLRRKFVGHGFTRSEYISGTQTLGAEGRLFHTMHGKNYDNVRAIVLPYVFGGKGDIDRRPQVRPNDRPEDLVIALDGSDRSWQGIFVPYELNMEPGTESEKLPVVGVVEDSKSKNTGNHALEEHRTVTASDPRASIDRIRWLAKIEDRIIDLQTQFAPPTHPSHSHIPRP